MADSSATFKPADIATSSDAASDAGSKLISKVRGSGVAQITVGDSAPAAPDTGDLWVDTSAALSNTISDAISKIAVVSDVASDALSKATALSDTVSKLGASVASDITSAASDALSKANSDAASKVEAALSDAKSYAASDAASKVAALSDAVSKTESDIRSDYGSKIAVVSAAASDAASASSDALSKIAVISDAASDALSKIAVVSDAASNAQSKITARSATWDTKTVILKVYNEASAIATGDGKMYFAIPASLNGMNLVSCGGHLYTAATSGVVGVMIRNVTSGADMLSSGKILEWDATEKDTATAAAASAAVISTGTDNVLTGEEIAIDIDAAASGAKGMEIRLQFRTV